MKRQRGRGRKPGGGGGGGNHGNRPLESNGPDVKIRGTAAQIYEKYAQYARDAQSGGDRVKYENYLQHAEHYYRVMAATMPRERLLAQQEGGQGFGQVQGEGGQGGFGQNPQGGPPPGMGGQSQGGEGQGDLSDPLKVMDDQGGDDGDDDGDDDREEVEASDEVRAQDDNNGNRGEGRGGRRRRGRRGRPHDGNNNGGDDRGGPNNNGGGNNGGSALDSLARKQGALAGG